jgi:hypothetical protein
MKLTRKQKMALDIKVVHSTRTVRVIFAVPSNLTDQVFGVSTGDIPDTTWEQTQDESARKSFEFQHRWTCHMIGIGRRLKVAMAERGGWK